MIYPKGEALRWQWEEKCPQGGTRDCCAAVQLVVLFALLADCSSAWLGRGHSYFPQIRALILLPPGFRITVLSSICWLQAVAPRSVWMPGSSQFGFSSDQSFGPKQIVVLDSTTLQDHNGYFGLCSFMKWWYKSRQKRNIITQKQLGIRGLICKYQK